MFDFEDLDYYELLGVPRAATTDEVKRAYRREISKYHPDRFAGAAPEEQEYAQRRSQAITEAYGVLSDFSARSSYNLGRSPQPRRGRTPSGGAAATPAQPRDHQAELYDQARAHLDAGRTVQAVGVLRQLQQINPFYRDSSDMLARAEAALVARQRPSRRGVPRPLLLTAGVLGGTAVVLLAAWVIGMRSTPTSATPLSTPAAIPTSPPAGAAATDPPATDPPAPTAEPPPTPTEAPPAPTAAPPSPAPTAPPTAIPTVAPTALSNAAPTAVPAEEQGRVLLGDDFGGAGWASVSGGGWSVGYSGGRYRIAVDAGVGAIWSYRSVPEPDVTMAVDVQAVQGAGGVVLRFQDESNYLAFVVDAQQGAYRLEQHSGAGITVLAAGLSDAVRTNSDAQNRLVAQVRGSSVRVSVNGTLLAEAEAAGVPQNGRFGLLAISGANPAEALFDNLQIRTVE